MCRPIRLLLIILGLSLTGAAWATDPVSVQFIGLSDYKNIENNVRLALQNEKSQITKPISKEGVQNFYKTAPRVIREALQPFGYFHPIIRSSITQKRNQWIILFNIQRGPPVYISKVILDIVGPGRSDPRFIRLAQHLPVKVGQVLNTEKYNKAKQLIYDVASTRGYFDSKMLENKIYINLQKNQAQIILKFQTGIRYHFGDTLFPASPFSPSFLKRFLQYKKGQKYNYHKVERTQKTFINSNYFTQAIVNPMTKKKKRDQVPINIKLITRKRYAYTLGAGFGTDTGPRGTFGFEVRRVNSHGHQFQTLIQGSEYNSNAFATYFIPGGNPASDVWSFTTGYARFNQVTGTGQSYKAEVNYTTALGQWKQTIALTYLDESYNIVAFLPTNTRVLYPNIHWHYISTKKLSPKNGFSIAGSLAAAPRMSSSFSGFAQGRIDINALLTFFNTTRLILRTSLARTEIRDLSNLPFSLQLFIGGARSLRGYSFNQIGPGRNLFVGSFEIQQRIFGDFYIVGFFDAGNVTNSNPFKNLNEAAGPGIAYVTPIGMVELTVANAFTQPNKPWIIQFAIGPVL